MLTERLLSKQCVSLPSGRRIAPPRSCWSRLRNLLSLLLVLYISASPALAANVKVKDGHLEFENQKYFRNGASKVEMGTYGRKHSNGRYLEPQGRLASSRLKGLTVRALGEITISEDRRTKASLMDHLEGAVAIAKGRRTIEITYEKLKSNQLRLVHLQIYPEQLRREVNDGGAALSYLRNHSKGRMVNEIFVVMEAELAEEVAASGTLEIEGEASDGTVTLKGSRKVSGGISKSVEVTYSEGMVIAYMLQKPKSWNRRFFKKTTIKEFTDDQWGPR